VGCYLAVSCTVDIRRVFLRTWLQEVPVLCDCLLQVERIATEHTAGATGTAERNRNPKPTQKPLESTPFLATTGYNIGILNTPRIVSMANTWPKIHESTRQRRQHCFCRMLSKAAAWQVV